MEKFGMFILGLISLVLMVMFNAFALVVLWGWFVVPLFGLPALSIVYAIGLELVVSMFKNNNIKKEKEYEFAESLAVAFVQPVTLLFIGWIITLFM